MYQRVKTQSVTAKRDITSYTSHTTNNNKNHNNKETKTVVCRTNIMFASSMLVILTSLLIANVFTITLPMQQSLAAPLTSQSAIPSNNIVTTTSTYEIMFTTATAGAIKTIEVRFPSGYNVGSAKVIESTRIGAGTVSANPLGIIYTVTSPVNVAAGTPVRLELASITTKNTAGTIIDGPTTASIPIKDIRTGDIGDGSVARPDIANNAITSAKV